MDRVVKHPVLIDIYIRCVIIRYDNGRYTDTDKRKNKVR